MKSLISKEKGLKKLLFNFAGIVLFALLLSQISVFDSTSLSYFSPTEKSVDFQSSDFYQLVSNTREERVLEERIVIIPVDNLSRLDISLLIEDLVLCEPQVIGLDVNFPFASESDSIVSSIIKETPSIVLPLGVRVNDDTNSWETTDSPLFDKLGNKQRGVINLNIDHPYNVVRTFIPFYKTDKGIIPNFSTAIALMADTIHDDMEKIMQKSEVEIDYSAKDFVIIEPSNVFDHLADIENRIVLLGAMDEAQDMHITPISDAMPGVIIHAYALSTILNKSYFKHLPAYLIWPLYLLFCITFVWVNAFLNGYQSGNMIMRLFQVAMIAFLIFLGCLLFVRFHIVLELSYPLTLTALGVAALDFWNGVHWFINKLFRLKK